MDSEYDGKEVMERAPCLGTHKERWELYGDRPW